MKKFIISAIFMIACFNSYSQTNIISTDSIAEAIMLGKYDPALYAPSVVINNPPDIANGINSEVSADTLKRYLEILSSFENRNTSSDTISTIKGIGAARVWTYSKFQEYSAANENRLIPSYLQFTQTIGTKNRHKNIFAVLPGSDTADKSIIIIEAHIDSRCEGVDDINCMAEGMEDNGSGTALVMELARVMSKYSFKNTIVFMATIGEEQGKYGANAFATYAKNKGIKIKAVLNNDVIGGIICGKTSSLPSCPGLNHIDSTQVRLFSYGTTNSIHKQLVRYIKLQYKEMLLPIVNVPMLITVMTAEDRTGRGGDHQPFRARGFAAMRFTSANEHGDASNGTGYTDRQHTTRDILGVDTTSDGILDSFFVDFNYLARNSVINGVGAAMAANGVQTPAFNLTSSGLYNLDVEITQQTQYPAYRIAVRTVTNDWDSVYTFSGSLKHTITVSDSALYFVSVASVDANGTESLFSGEQQMIITGIRNGEKKSGEKISLLQNKPNPFDETTAISVMVDGSFNYKNAHIAISDLQGKEVSRINVVLKEGINEVIYDHGYNVTGTYIYSLVVDGKQLMSKKLVFTN